jgi:heme oxygenase
MLDPTHLIQTSESAGRSSSPKDDTPPVLVALRSATAARHELLHEIMPLSVESVDLRDYLAHLVILREWLEPLEAWIETFDDGPQSPSAQMRTNRLGLIDADLSDKSVRRDDLPSTVASPGRARWWLNAGSAAYRWGVCYVIEGSQLGGAVLYTRLRERLSPHPLAFLASGRESLGARWRAFTHRMAEEVTSPATIDEACRGAADAFDVLIERAQWPTRANRTDIA